MCKQRTANSNPHLKWDQCEELTTTTTSSMVPNVHIKDMRESGAS